MRRPADRRTWLLYAVGVLVVGIGAITAFDPAMIVWLLEPELLALFVESAAVFGLVAARGWLPSVVRTVREGALKRVARGHLLVVRVVG